MSDLFVPGGGSETTDLWDQRKIVQGSTMLAEYRSGALVTLRPLRLCSVTAIMTSPNLASSLPSLHGASAGITWKKQRLIPKC